MAADLDLVIRARRAVVDGAEVPAAVGVAGGRIAVVTTFDDAPPAARTVTLEDDEVLLPGLVDTHVHVNEPGRSEWEGFATATRAAAAGGVTTIVDMPLNSVPPTTTLAALEVKRRAAEGQVWVDVGFWAGAVPGNRPDLEPLHRAGVFGFKCFLLDSGVDEFGHLEPAQFALAMRDCAGLGALMIVHAEDGRLLDETALDGVHYAGFLASRPDAAETAAIELVIAQARATGCRAHIVHLSSAGAVPALREAREAGVDVSVETCPHYLTFDAEHIADGATELKCCPPIRDSANREALWAALAAGDLDFVVSDHSPCTADLKARGGGDFGVAWGGIASVQLGLPAVWTAARARGHALVDVVRWMATAPADRIGLRHKGRIAAGADADLVRFAPGEEFVVDVTKLHHRNPVSAYAGRRLAGVVRETWLRGRPVGDMPHGRLLRRHER
ncbi:allantoinase AllB [Jiangella ureilytica]|uniref:allantoinase n=1 Tax=Jiangella ureilytica TaxID=2530374 RepID=A0A4R4RK67_9ACTN|nr:allantoinase AllB [Jiangella ureilytica]TDC48883.1 allantoinase AllB [Jiangella ureilytica]